MEIKNIFEPKKPSKKATAAVMLSIASLATGASVISENASHPPITRIVEASPPIASPSLPNGVISIKNTSTETSNFAPNEVAGSSDFYDPAVGVPRGVETSRFTNKQP